MPTKCLTGRECLQCEDTGQRDESRPGQDGAGQLEICNILCGMVHNLKLRNYFWNFPFHILRQQSTITETVETETPDKGGGLLYLSLMMKFQGNFIWLFQICMLMTSWNKQFMFVHGDLVVRAVGTETPGPLGVCINRELVSY